MGRMMRNKTVSIVVLALLLAALLASACQPQPASIGLVAPEAQAETAAQELQSLAAPATPLPTRPAYAPGELVDYVVQTGDTLPALARHFNTHVEEIRAANPVIPQDATTLPPGMPMKIPIYYAPLWGSPFKILPDSLFVNGPAQRDFDTRAFVAGHPGWLNGYGEYVADANRRGAEIVDLVGRNFSVSPRLLLALLEYQAGALNLPTSPGGIEPYFLGKVDRGHRGLYLQLVWAANALNNGYYDWRTGELQSILRPDGTLERPDPWQNAATVSLQSYFADLFSVEDYAAASGSDGIAKTYQDLFGDPWSADRPHLP